MNGLKQPSGHTGMQLFDVEGRRLYFTEEERRAFMAAAAKAPREVRAFCGVLHATGCRVSEALALTAANIDLSGRVIVFESLKKRKRGVFRAVPVSPGLLDMLDLVHAIRETQRRGDARALLWPWGRMTAWRRVGEVIAAAGIPDGPHACPKGLRHGFGVQAVGRCVEHGAEVAGARPAHHDGDLRQRRGRGGAEHRGQDVVTRCRHAPRGSPMSCTICADQNDITDFSAPYTIRTCEGCGREIALRKPGAGGNGIRIDEGDRFVIPPGFIQIALNPLKGRGQLSRSGASWFAQLVFVGDYGTSQGDVVGATKAERDEYEAALKAANFFGGLDVTDDSQADAIFARAKEQEATSAFWAFWADILLAGVEGAVRANDARKAAWTMAYAQRCRAMYVFKEHFEEVAWMGHSARRLVQLLGIWDANKTNDNEEFWQTTLQDHAFAFSQLFSVPVTFIEGKAYVGGMSLDRKDAKFADFVLAGGAANNAILVEIKAPGTKLLGRKYRSVYAPSRDLSGAVVQVEDYKTSMMRELDSLNRTAARPLSSFKPRRVIISGHYAKELDTQQKADSFELFRSAASEVEMGVR